MNRRTCSLLSALLLVLLVISPIFTIQTKADGDDLWGKDGLDISIDKDGAKINTGDANQESAFQTVLKKYQGIISAVLAFAVATCLLFAIINGVKLATTASQPQQHQQAKKAFGWTLGGTALLGSIALIVRLAYNAIDKK